MSSIPAMSTLTARMSEKGLEAHTKHTYPAKVNFQLQIHIFAVKDNVCRKVESGELLQSEIE